MAAAATEEPLSRRSCGVEVLRAVVWRGPTPPAAATTATAGEEPAEEEEEAEDAVLPAELNRRVEPAVTAEADGSGAVRPREGGLGGLTGGKRGKLPD